MAGATKVQNALDEWQSRRVPTCLGGLRVRSSGRGPTIVFWPSLLMDGAMWAAEGRHFAGRFRVVLVDPPGHGESEPLSRGFTFDECARCVVQLADAFDAPRVHFVGNSWGGMIGGTFVARHPDRAGAAVLMNATASAAGLWQRLEFLALLRAARLLGGVRGPLVGRAVRAFLGPTTLRERPEVEAEVREALARVRVESVRWAVHSVVPARPDQRALLSSVSTPVLVVAGEEDPTFRPAEARRMAEAIPGAEFRVMRATGHLAGLERPEEVSGLVDEFLARHAARAGA